MATVAVIDIISSQKQAVAFFADAGNFTPHLNFFRAVAFKCCQMNRTTVAVKAAKSPQRVHRTIPMCCATDLRIYAGM